MCGRPGWVIGNQYASQLTSGELALGLSCANSPSGCDRVWRQSLPNGPFHNRGKWALVNDNCGSLLNFSNQRGLTGSISTTGVNSRSAGVPVGVAGHSPEAHLWVDGLDAVDFHAVCFFNCGSVHSKQGHKFRLADPYRAVECIRRLRKPCIGYKIMGAGRIDPAMAFEFAFDNIKPQDCIVVGMFPRFQDEVKENCDRVRRILGVNS